MAEIYRPQKFAGIKIARFTRVEAFSSRETRNFSLSGNHFRYSENHFTVIPLIRLHLRDLSRVSRELASRDFSKIERYFRGARLLAKKECIVTGGIVSRRCAQLRRAA